MKPVVKVSRLKPKAADLPLLADVQIREAATAMLPKGGSVSILAADSVGLKITSLKPSAETRPLVCYQVDTTLYSGDQEQEKAIQRLVELGRLRKA